MIFCIHHHTVMHRYAHLCQNQTELKRFDAFGFHVKNGDLWEQQTLKSSKEKLRFLR